MAIQDKFNKANTIYKITKDIDLGATTLTIPANCTLDFQGGSFSNGNLVCNFTKVSANYRVFKEGLTLSGRVIGSISPLHFGAYESDNPIMNYNSIYMAYEYANILQCSVSWEGISEIQVTVPAGAKSIKLTGYNDFNGVTIRVTNNSKTLPLFLISNAATDTPITISKSLLEGLDYSSVPELRDGMYLLKVKDETIWTVRNDNGTISDVYREDLILINNGQAYNRPIYSYESDVSSPSFTYIPVNSSSTVVNNLNIVREEASTFVTYAIRCENINNLQLNNITVYTPPGSSLTNDLTFYIMNCSMVKMSNISINGLYDVTSYAYGIYMNNCYNIVFDRINTANDRWGIFGTYNLNTVSMYNSSVNRFDIHCYGKDISFTGCKFRGIYNQIGCVYGNISFLDCTFENFIPIQYEGSFNAYVPHDVTFTNCTLTNQASFNYLLRCYNLTATVNSRPELSKKCLPNVTVNNLIVNGEPSIFYIFYTYEPNIVTMDYIEHIRIDGLKLVNWNETGMDIAIRDIRTYNTVNYYFANIDLLQVSDADIALEPAKNVISNPLNITKMVSPNGVVSTINVKNSRFGFPLSSSTLCNFNFEDCTITSIKNNNSTNHGVFTNCRLYLTNISDDNYQFAYTNSIYTNCHFIRFRTADRLRLYNIGYYKFIGCTKNTGADLLLYQGLNALDELMGIECDIPVISAPLIYDYTAYTRGTTDSRPTLGGSFVCQYYDTTLKKYILWNGTSWVNIDGTPLT